jgi:uncharacterized protein with PIN domain
VIHVTVGFHEDLEFFLSRTPAARNSSFTFAVTRSVKDLIESLGVPHVEVAGIEVNDVPVGFDYLLNDGDFVYVHPASPSPAEGEATRFIADVHVKTLARYLRMLGFDTLYDRGWDDVTLASISQRENRVLLSRDTRLLMRSNITRGMYVRSIHPRTQIIDVIKRYNLSGRIDPFKRCITCNGEISPVAKDALISGKVPQDVLARTNSFYRCGYCGKYYWNGTHVEKMAKRIDDIRRETG